MIFGLLIAALGLLGQFAGLKRRAERAAKTGVHNAQFA